METVRRDASPARDRARARADAEMFADGVLRVVRSRRRRGFAKRGERLVLDDENEGRVRGAHVLGSEETLSHRVVRNLVTSHRTLTISERSS